MTDINTANLLDQIRAMSSKIEGSKVESSGESAALFGNAFQQALNQVNDLTQNADQLKTKYELGDQSVSLAEVMIASQKASLGFEAAVRVRNKVVEAYQDIMNMPV
jgi:flagellar hook-basal body complex protein FliE